VSKRACDLALAGLGLALTWPLLLVIALLVRLDSPGPVLFRHERVGKDGRPFRILKFRSMVEHADRLGPRLTQKRDPRITRIGQLLRWLKLDELPQLINVLRGDMSLVGPRPEDPHFVRFYSPEQRRVLSVRPGVVGPSQILGRDELERYPDDVADYERYYVEHILPEKLATDLRYVQSYGLRGDLTLIFAGLAVTLLGAFKGRWLRLNRRRLALLAFDTAASLAVYHLASGLKFEWAYDRETVGYLAIGSLLILLVRPPIFVYCGLYQHTFRYLGTTEFRAICRAVALGSLVVAGMALLLGFGSHSRLVFLLDGALLVLVLFGSRVALETRLERRGRRRDQQRRAVLIVGVDDTAAELVRTMAAQDGLAYEPQGFLDDDPGKRGVSIHGIPVRGCVKDLALVAAMAPVHLVLILVPLVASTAVGQVVAFCRSRRIEYRLVPTLERLLRGPSVLPELDAVEAAEPGRAGPRDGEADGGGRGAGAPAGGRTGASRGSRAEAPWVLVTGGAGFVGSHVVRKLLARGRRVRVVDSYLYGSHGLQDVLGHPGVEVIRGDIRHLGTMVRATRDVDVVIALAALVGDPACELDLDETVSTNREATRLLAEVCRRSGVRRLVFASSCSVYGANSELVLNEGSWLNPVSLYASTRIESEEVLLRQRDRFCVTILRLATVFGLSRRMRLDLLVNTFTAHAFFHERVRVFGGGQWRPNVHVQDAAEAFVLVAAEAPEAKVRGEIFNVGDDGLNRTVRDVAHLVQGVLPGTAIELAEQVGDARDYRVSFAKIRHVLGFRPRFAIEDGIREVVGACRAGEIRDATDPLYSNVAYLRAHGFPETSPRVRSTPVAAAS